MQGRRTGREHGYHVRLDFDSLDKVDIVMQIEEAYDISLGDNMALSTVGELVKKIDEAVANK